jgi:type IV pilus assembly protein PilF
VLVFALSACSTTPSQPEPPSLTKNVAKNPQAAVYNAQLGVGYLQQGDVSRAKSKLLLAAKQDPSSQNVWGSLAYFYENTGDAVKASEYYRKAVSLDPKAGAALNNYGAFLCQQKQYTESVRYFLAATKDQDYLNPENAYENAGLCAEKVPDMVNAEQYFTRALQNNPNLPTSNLEMAKINFKKGKFDFAERYLERYNKVAKPSAESLWLDMQLAQRTNDTQRIAKDVEVLKEHFSQSNEYKQAKLSGLIT